ncbi:MAG: hypothetical protein Athens071416_264 [Parcubacteria group bacterium Athens0714_16]|nr:MAG: hypothetical protein Athens071416_264 [Parcubacteria group bacterium Athens0714_16]
MNKEKIENVIKIYALLLIIFLFMIIISDVKNETQTYPNENTPFKKIAKSQENTPINKITDLKPSEPKIIKETPTQESTTAPTPTDLPAVSTPTEQTEKITPPINQQPTTKETVSFDIINKSTRGAIVNILCTTESSGSFNPISGSGIIINKEGVILTNAHIAQYFLLRDYIKKDFVTCSIRMGSPSQSIYKAEPLYISGEWITKNYQNITQKDYSENGESDYAFLLITETTNNENKLPNEFPWVDYDTEENTVGVGENVLLAGYPAGFLGGITIQKDLNIATTIEQIKKLYTFSEKTLDLISLGGSVLAQKGSSGGAVVNNQNKLIGLIVTTTESKLTQERDLRAITLAHINRNLEKEIGLDIKNFLSFNLLATSKSFDEIKAPVLKNLLITALEK